MTASEHAQAHSRAAWSAPFGSREWERNIDLADSYRALSRLQAPRLTAPAIVVRLVRALLEGVTIVAFIAAIALVLICLTPQ